MKIRILSDLHLNKNLKFCNPNFFSNFKKDNILTIIAGDISNDINETHNFLKEHFNKVIFIEGNHFATNTENTLEEHYELHKKIFPKNSNHIFLQDDYIIIDDIVFIGTTLWTNHKYDKNKLIYNDLYYQESVSGKATYIENNQKKNVNSNYIMKLHETSLDFIKKTLIKFKDKKCVLIIHHGISDKIIADEWKDYKFNNTLISNLENEFDEFENLKLIIHGHAHGTHNYTIGKNNIPVICNAMGEYYKSNDHPNNVENPKFNPNLIIEI